MLNTQTIELSCAAVEFLLMSINKFRKQMLRFWRTMQYRLSGILMKAAILNTAFQKIPKKTN